MRGSRDRLARARRNLSRRHCFGMSVMNDAPTTRSGIDNPNFWIAVVLRKPHWASIELPSVRSHLRSADLTALLPPPLAPAVDPTACANTRTASPLLQPRFLPQPGS